MPRIPQEGHEYDEGPTHPPGFGYWFQERPVLTVLHTLTFAVACCAVVWTSVKFSGGVPWVTGAAVAALAALWVVLQRKPVVARILPGSSWFWERSWSWGPRSPQPGSPGTGPCPSEPRR